MTVNPYMSPTTVASPSALPDMSSRGTVAKSILIGMCAAIAGVSCVSVSAAVPTIVSPFPFLVIMPVFNGIPVPVVAVLMAVSFAISQFRHFKNTPRAKPHFGFTVLLAIVTGLTAFGLIADWSFSMGYHGALYTIGVSIANLLCAAIVWSTWWASRTTGRYKMQVVFGFTLFSWLVSYALPYTGELP
jgi:hypothetical protein